MSGINRNKISAELKQKLKNFKWGSNNVMDLHKEGVHYFSPEFLPTWIDLNTHIALYHRGLTQPNALSSYFPENTQQKIKDWYGLNYFKLKDAGIQHLGNELNLQIEEEFESAKVRALILRLTEYEICDGSISQYIVGQFVNDFMEDVFIDYGFIPPTNDLGKYLEADIPLWFGNITKRPLMDFDIVVVSHCYPVERAKLAFAMVKSGIPLYRWERWDHSLPYYEKCPIFCIAGMGSSSVENLIGDNPIYGVAENSMVDGVLVGEGENMFLKFLQEYQQTVVEVGGSKEDFINKLSNKYHQGWYDPRYTLFEYSDKKHILSDPSGKVLGEEVWEGGGRIKRISLLNTEAKEKYVLAGPESEEWQDMEEMQGPFLDNILGGDVDRLQKKYIRELKEK